MFEDGVQSRFNMCLCDVYSYDVHRTHIPIKSRSPIKKSYGIRPTSLLVNVKSASNNVAGKRMEADRFQ